MINTLDSAIIPAEYEIKEIPKTEYTSVLSRSEVRELVSKYDWDVEVMVDIIFCESSFRPGVINDNPTTRDFSVGLAQINLYGVNAKHRPPVEDLIDPVKNIAFAYDLYSSGGFKHWSCYKKIRIIKTLGV